MAFKLVILPLVMAPWCHSTWEPECCSHCLQDRKWEQPCIACSALQNVTFLTLITSFSQCFRPFSPTEYQIWQIMWLCLYLYLVSSFLNSGFFKDHFLIRNAFLVSLGSTRCPMCFFPLCLYMPLYFFTFHYYNTFHCDSVVFSYFVNR